MLLTRIWWNFTSRFLGTSRTDSDSHGAICPSNICPGDICTYQEYIICYWPHFDETLKVAWKEPVEHIQIIKLTFVQTTFAHIRNIVNPQNQPSFNSTSTDTILMKLISSNLVTQILPNKTLVFWVWHENDFELMSSNKNLVKPFVTKFKRLC